MRTIFFPIQKILILYLFVQLVIGTDKITFLTIAGSLLLLSIFLEGARPVTPIFIMIITIQYFDLSLVQAIFIAIAGLLIFILRFYHINIPLKGPYDIGHKYIRLDDNGKHILAAIYYPTNQKGKKVEWVPEKTYNKTLYEIFYVDPKTTRLPYQIFKFAVSYIEKIWMPVEGDAPYYKQKNQNQNKLIIFSHGLGAHLNAYTSFCANWASYGYTVLTINHTNDEVCLDYRECKTDDVDVIRKFLHDRRYRDLQVRVNQIKVVMNQVLQNKLLENTFGESFNINEIILSGHSYGGGTVVALKSMLRKQLPKNHKILAMMSKIICFDPWFFPFTDELFENLDDQNILIINSQYFYQDVPEAYYLEKLFSQLKSVTPKLQAYLVEKMDHICQCDMAYVFGNILQLTGTIKYHRYTDYFMALNILMSRQFLGNKEKEELLKISNQFLNQHKMSEVGIKVREQFRTTRQMTMKKYDY